MHLVSSSQSLRDDLGHPHHPCHRRDPRCFHHHLPEHNGNCPAELFRLTGWRLLHALEEKMFVFDEDLCRSQLTRRGGRIVGNILENDQWCGMREETGVNSLVSIPDWMGDDWATSNWQDNDDFQNGIRETVYLLPTEKFRRDHRSEQLDRSLQKFLSPSSTFHWHLRQPASLHRPALDKYLRALNKVY